LKLPLVLKMAKSPSMANQYRCHFRPYTPNQPTKT
jgi:hypothetical protein